MLRHNTRPARLVSRHESEMEVLWALHERVLSEPTLREKVMIDAGIFVRNPDGTIAVAKPYSQVLLPAPAD